MADPVLQPDQTVAPSTSQGPDVTATPPAAAPAAAAEPEALSSAAPAPAADAAPPPAASVDAPPASDTTQQPEPAADGSLLTDAKTKAPEAPKAEAEAPKTDAAPAAEAAPTEPAPPPTFEAFTIPEGVTLDDAKLGDFTKALGEFESGTKADHAQVQALGQRLVDMYTAEAKDLVQRIQTNQVETWNRTREGWIEEFRKDPEIGGNRQQTTLSQCALVIERFGAESGAENEAALRDAFKVTGIGDHPAMIRFINWASKFATERARPVAAVVPKPPVANTRAQRRYGNQNGA